MSLLHGLSAFPITPCDAFGVVDTDAVASLVTRLEEADVNSIGLLGSTGTYAYLSRAERERAVKAAASVIRDTPLIVGIGALRTDAVVAMANDAENAGADGLLLAPVSYTPLTQNEVFAHFQTVAAATDLPICIYNNPGTTHFRFERTLLQRLADIPNVRAVKMPLPEDQSIGKELAELRQLFPDDFHIGYSGDWGCAEALLAGADTWYSVLGGILPDISLALTKAAQSGDAQQADALNDTLAPVWNLFKEYGSLRVVYAIANHLNLTQAEPPLPILPLGYDSRERIVAALDAITSRGLTRNLSQSAGNPSP